MIRRRIKSMILRPFCPKIFTKSIFDIDYPLLKQDGIVYLLFDLDNTLVARDDSHVSNELKKILRRLKADGFKIAIVSNNWGERVKSFAAKAGVPVVARAAKPMSRAFKRTMKMIGADREKTAVIGDQIFTDIFGANRLGLVTILVPPVSNVDLIHTKLFRRLEKIILKQLVALGYLPDWQNEKG